MIVKLLWGDDLVSRTTTIVFKFFKSLTGQKRQPKSGLLVVIQKNDLGSQHGEHVEVAPLNGGQIVTGAFFPPTLSISNNLLIFDCLKISPNKLILANQDWNAICRPKFGMENSTVESTIRQIISYELSSSNNQKSNADFKISYSKELNEVLLTSFMNISKTSPNNKLLETFDILAFIQQCQAFNKKLLRILYMFNKEFLAYRAADNSFTVGQYLKLRYPKEMEADRVRFTTVTPNVAPKQNSTLEELWRQEKNLIQDNY